MYYGNDADGNIVMSTDSGILPDVYQDLFPSQAPDSVSDGDAFIDVTQSPDSGDGIPDSEENSSPVDFPSFDFVTYDDLIDLMAAIPGYNVYPNTSAVNVFSDVLNGVSGSVGYVILSGADTNSTYLYYSNKYSVSGKTVTLYSPVTYCNYYSYRPSSSSSYIYTYTVSTIGDTSFTFSNQLAYTNLLDGYPDVLPFKQKETYSLFFIIAFSLLVLFLIMVVRYRGGRK